MQNVVLQCTLQQYVDDLFVTILRVDGTLPPAVKYLFDLLDAAAKRHNIADSDVVHTWKSNRYVSYFCESLMTLASIFIFGNTSAALLLINTTLLLTRRFADY